MTREEAIAILKKGSLFCPTLENRYYPEAFDMAIKALEKEPKTGQWRPVYQGDEIINYRCSECEFGNTFGKSTYRMNYCPNCGSYNKVKMSEIPTGSEMEG